GFTYAAVALSAIPMGIAYMAKHPETRTEAKEGMQTASDGEGAQLARDPEKVEVGKQEGAAAASGQEAQGSFGKAIGVMALYGLASPFLELQDPIHGVIGLIILVIGIRIAWQLTGAQRAEITGPFQNTPAAP